MRVFSKIIGKANTAARLPLREKLWFCAMYPLCGLTRIAIFILPFRIVAKIMGEQLSKNGSPNTLSAGDAACAWRLGRTCTLTSRYTPWESKCLVQAIVLRAFLKFYRIPCTVFIGVMKENEPFDTIKAHAWVKVGDKVIIGQKGHSAFTPLATYWTPRGQPIR